MWLSFFAPFQDAIMSRAHQIAFDVARLALLLQCAVLPVFSSPGNVVDTGYAQYRGNQSFPNTVAYLGIPYAEPPLGELRFRAPLPLNTSRVAAEAGGKVIDATTYPNFCIQGSTGAGDAGGAGSEDCLKVNIYAPTGAKEGSNLPVLVYIHGGGYFYGNPANWPFDPWVHQSPNVVIVSVYYRLDAFGFLSIPEFSDSSIGDSNAGFSDQILALKWVNEHISSFGGDPQAVTINGQSAGGASVELHMVANTETNLFRGVIAQSVYRTPLAFPEQRVAQFQLFASTAGCGTGSIASQMACLRSASVSALARSQDFVSSTLSGYHLFQPVIDEKIFTDFPTRQLDNGKFKNVAVIVGSTTNETLAGGATIAAALQAYFPSMSNETAAAFVAEYPLSEFASEALQVQVATGEPSVVCGRDIIAAAVTTRNQAWTYRYNQPNPTQGGFGGTAHAAENWMMFQGINTGFNGSGVFTPMTPVETAFAEELIAYWLSFVRSGDPNTFKLARSPLWPQFTTSNKARIVLQQDQQNITTQSGIFSETQPALEGQRCSFIAEHVVPQQN
ncbi:Aldolase-II domain-containing protein [Mycena sanguinolenta]|uniref:Carboxylic ester hydrolase n=1 Tax=Mycena sanguinolenta TaxID=230812 RepID=A0A8H6Y2M6_9AGAR|nr:Aldolase-II domain-containing protein [Mycena sanguinolenta]